MKSISVSAKTIRSGFQITLQGKKYTQIYPSVVWKSFPGHLRTQLAQTAAVFFTNHLAITQKAKLDYDFPPPPSYSLFFHGLIYSLLEVSQFVPKPLESVKKAFDANLNLSFQGLPRMEYFKKKLETENQKSSALLFTFGKDSLVTYGLAKELGFKTELYFFNEPLSPNEFYGRREIRRKFEIQFKQKINYIDLNLGKLRQNGGEMWGWDMILLEYILLLIPFIYSLRMRFMMVASEYNNNEININSDRMKIFYRFEQNSQWTLNSNHLLSQFGLSANCVSLIEPLYEYLTTYILHSRYPELSGYQLSCGADDVADRNQRWCGQCAACARSYIFLRSMAVDPGSVGLRANMLRKDNIRHFDIFDNRDKKISDWREFTDSHCELLLAFYLADLRSVKGDLMELFKNKFGKKIRRNRHYLVERVLSLHKPESLPANLQNRVMNVFKKEVSKLKGEITELFSARV